MEGTIVITIVKSVKKTSNCFKVEVYEVVEV
jgi:hypothetical protein